jgi:hypothetical protein
VTEESIRDSLTPLGRLFLECRNAARTHPFRGVPYNPVAVILHHDHGWYPQPNLYSREHSGCVWGNIPWNASDQAVAAFFDRVYPGYRAAASHPDERGKIVDTPFGDLFDIVLSNADSACLARYRAVLLSPDCDPKADPGLAERLAVFEREGGTVADLVEVETLDSVLRPYRLVHVEGPPVYHAVNVTDRPDELLVTLCNNTHTEDWEGRVHVPGEEIIAAEEWLSDGDAGIEAGMLNCRVPANDVRIVRVRTRKPFLPLKYQDVPWTELGYGVAE